MLTYLFYFAITVGVEYAVVQTILVCRNCRGYVAVSVLVANLATHPLTYFLITYVATESPHDTTKVFFAAEFVVPIIESFVSVYILKPCGFSTLRVVIATVLANLISASLSFVV